ncbi:phosphonate ABC transporter ATP-binding protein [Haloferax prahovense]|uniref:phosphonate ABC transporter ATP-binding protein n=1 Tax=Haloferax TaxID=2251 RepID=UPI000737C09A|nr:MULTISPECIES: phosphonate ABC transporter ATP-binding protein [unclassified Haloferax]MCO8266876.1 phosphonate ABC transporter ATP-binding protein [Haloferax sp. AB510]
MSTIEVRNLTKAFGDVRALDDVSFTIEDGEFAVLLGQSGAGKSTLLRCLNGLTKPTSGEIRIDGEPVKGPRDDVAMIFQQHYVLGQLSAYGNALTGALNRTSFLRSLVGWHSEEDKFEALRALETVGLLDQASQRTRSMSGGQQQRVGIARALVQGPSLLLADEPVASLDPASAETVMGYIRSAAAERDLSTLASLHQVNLAREFGERFLALRDGELVFDGYREDLTVDVIDRIYGDVQTADIREGTEVSA